MASPIAHLLAGALIYTAVARRPKFNDPLLWVVILAANLPDLDLIPGLLLGDEGMYHRTISHSLMFVLSISLLTFLFLWFKKHPQMVRLTLMVCFGLLSQIVIDWLSYDDTYPQGIALLWPFSEEFYMAHHTVFLHVRRDNLLDETVIIHNLWAVGRELMIMGPLLLVTWVAAHRRTD